MSDNLLMVIVVAVMLGLFRFGLDILHWLLEKWMKPDRLKRILLRKYWDIP